MADRKQQKRMLSKFIQVFLTTFALLMIVIAIGTIIYVVVAQKSINQELGTPDFSNTATVGSGSSDVDGDSLDDKKMTVFAIFGVDEDLYRTDVTMMVFFNHETGKIDVLSIPRDTKVKIPDELYEQIQARRSDVDQYVKINSVPAYVIDDRNEASVAVMEKSFGVDIDYYVKMDLDVFKYIVDTIGEITVTIPFDMEYSDPEQELFINLKAGEQLINGAHAEQLIRFRSGYSNGDLGRIEMQHEFMKAFMKQLLTMKNRVNMLNIVSGILMRVETNFETAVDYLVYMEDIDPENIEMHTLPQESGTEGRADFIYDYDATKVLLDEIMNEPYESVTTDSTDNTETEVVVTEPVVDIIPEEIIDVKGMDMQVLNGTDIGGIAGKMTAVLEELGYQLMDADNYADKPVERTMIIVPKEEVFDELKVHFEDPEMVLRPSMSGQSPEVQIVLGMDDGENLQ